MSPIRTAAAPLALAAVLVLSACSDQVSPDVPEHPTGSASAPTAVEAAPADVGDVGVDAPCELVDETTVARLVGEELREHQEGAVGKIPGCVWGSMNGPGLRVASVPAEVWGASVPEILDQLLETGGALLDEESMERLEKAQGMVEQGELLSAGEACDIFSTMAELTGQAPGSDYSVSYVPDLDDPIAVSAQACVDGRYLSLLVISSQVEVSAATEARLVEALADLSEA
ncbi:DUF3558 family protein [Isoptericola sp. NPDC057653]|uniref:DUF3558 family protein n=1 Tax=Isoptericola sp. NPDC057653 TaxID=3346195 RepID=UPI0036AE71B9